MEIDSDTEDAALVLEGLAMGGGSKLGGTKNANTQSPVSCNTAGVPNGDQLTQDTKRSPEKESTTMSITGSPAVISPQAGASPVKQESSSSGADGNRCPGNPETSDILDPRRMGRFDQAMEFDRKVDLMLPVAEGGTSRDADEIFVEQAPGNPLIGPVAFDQSKADDERRARQAGKEANSTAKDANSTAKDAAVGDSKEGIITSDSAPTETIATHAVQLSGNVDDDVEMQETNVASDNPEQDRGNCGATTKPCKLAMSNQGLFRLKQGPETMLGFGMGWAFGAAEAIGDYKTSEFFVDGGSELDADEWGVVR